MNITPVLVSSPAAKQLRSKPTGIWPSGSFPTNGH